MGSHLIFNEGDFVEYVPSSRLVLVINKNEEIVKRTMRSLVNDYEFVNSYKGDEFLTFETVRNYLDDRFSHGKGLPVMILCGNIDILNSIWSFIRCPILAINMETPVDMLRLYPEIRLVMCFIGIEKIDMNFAESNSSLVLYHYPDEFRRRVLPDLRTLMRMASYGVYDIPTLGHCSVIFLNGKDEPLSIPFPPTPLPEAPKVNRIVTPPSKYERIINRTPRCYVIDEKSLRSPRVMRDEEDEVEVE